MKDWLTDVFDWFFMQQGFSWKEWRELCKSSRSSGREMPENWNGEW